MKIPSLLGAAALIVLIACASDKEPRPAAASDVEPSLAGSWRLVRIQSMDDTVYLPDDRDAYTLKLAPDGKLAVRADCNRGKGTWEREGSSGLRFGPLALTKVLCPPQSLHDRFVSDLSYVRSFVLRDGKLFLATMADGAILELEPVP